MRPVRTSLLLLAATQLAATTTTQPTTGPAAAMSTAMRRARQVAIANLIYVAQHRGVTPANLGQVLPSLGGDAAAVLLTPDDERRLAPLPAAPTADWAVAHTSWVYLSKDLKVTRVRRPWETVMFHSAVDAPFDHPTRGKVVLLAYMDGHVDWVAAEQAKEQIAKATATFDAARADGHPK